MYRKPLALALALSAAIAHPLLAQKTTVLRAARMIDGTGKAPAA